MSKLLEQINKKPYKLSSLIELVGGGTPKTTNQNYWNGDIPWLSVVDFNNDSRWVFNTEKKITKSGLENSSTKILDKGDFIISARGTVGALAELGLPMAFNQSCYGIKPNQNLVERNYLYYLLSANIYLLKKAANGGVFDTIIKESFDHVNVEIPDLSTQKKIAEILSAYDTKIENNNKIIKNLETTAQTIFNEWFVKFEFPVSLCHSRTVPVRSFERRRVGGNPVGGYKSYGGKMVESEMGEIPEGWEVKSLDNLCDISIGRTPPRQEQEWFSKNPKDVKWISIKDLGVGGIFISKTDEYLTQEAVNKFNIPVIPKGTLVVSFKLTMGKVAITTENMLSNEAIAHLKIKNDTCVFTEYLYLVMKTYNYDSLGSTSSIATAVNSKTIKNIKIIVPKNETLNKFRKTIKPLFEMMNVVQTQNKNLKLSKDQLLAKLI